MFTVTFLFYFVKQSTFVSQILEFKKKITLFHHTHQSLNHCQQPSNTYIFVLTAKNKHQEPCHSRPQFHTPLEVWNRHKSYSRNQRWKFSMVYIKPLNRMSAIVIYSLCSFISYPLGMGRVSCKRFNFTWKLYFFYNYIYCKNSSREV